MTGAVGEPEETPKHLSHTTAGSEDDENERSKPQYIESNLTATTAETPLLANKQPAASQPKVKQCSIGVTIANLMKNIIGAGLLALPRSFALTGNVLGTILILIFGIWSALTFSLVGYMGHNTGTSDFAQLWTVCFGKKSAWIVDLIMFLCTGCLCLGFSIIICDFLSEFNLSIGLPWWACTRWFVGIIALIPILPLAYSKSLNSLGWVSILGLLATAYTFVYVVADTIKFKADGGDANFGQPRSKITLLTVLEAVSLFGTAYVCHYNAPKFNVQLKNSTAKRFNEVSLVSFVGSGLVYAVFAWAGHDRFGDRVNGDVLTDYQGPSAGIGCMLMWLFMALCLICGYPVTYLSSQESLYRLGFHLPTWIYVSLLMLGGILIHNLSFFLALEGSLLGVTVGFTLPGIMFVALAYKTAWAKTELPAAGLTDSTVAPGDHEDGRKHSLETSPSFSEPLLSHEDHSKAAVTAVGKSSMAVSIINCVKNIIGAGILSLPRSFVLSGDILGTVLIMIFAFWNAGSFALIGYMNQRTGTNDFKSLWNAGFGRKTAWIVDLFMFLYTASSCLGFNIVIDDFLVQFCRGIHLPAWICTRWVAALISLLGIMPLAYKKSLDSLRYVSFFGIAASFYCILYVIIDAIRFAMGDVIDPSVDDSIHAPVTVFSAVQAMSIFAPAYVCHYNAPRFNKELKHTSPGRFSEVSYISFIFSGIVYAAFALAGHFRFGDGVHGDVLTNYGGRYANIWCLLMWLAMALCLIFGYPLTYISSNESLERLGVHCPPWLYIIIMTVAGVFIKDLSVFRSYQGAILGISVGLTLPGLMYLGLVWRRVDWAKRMRGLTWFSWASVAMGLFCMIVGCVATSLQQRHH
ncbi:Solute carrier 38 member [Perkinsus chesapeaki]|uniref:Solute carrier 38 member n=1 Tax=Perkinsus chesapeaki TaxID=330153 RepID=A0A7J6MZQ6_PERCH|nr:Solute carrier 38 member [Perkinsus chesapeaki]